MTERLIDLGFTCRPWQEEVFKNLLRFSVLVVHRRGGKTVLAVMKLIDAALRCTKENGRFAYLAPQLNQTKDLAWSYIKHYAGKVPGVLINESELFVQFPNGARIRLYGADNPDSLRGRYFDGLVIDEVAQVKRELWAEILLPALADRQGWAMFIGTPKGINLFSEIYFKALQDTATWYAKSYRWQDTGALPVEVIEQMRKEMTPQQFRQEMECDFSASGDNVLISIEDARKASNTVLREEQIAYAPRVLGVDVAWSGGDRSVIMPRQGLQAFEPVIRQGLPEKSFAALVAQEAIDFEADAIFVDNTGGYGGEVVSILTEMGYNVLPVVFSGKATEERFLNKRAEMWFAMAAWIKAGASIWKNESLIAELCSPTYDNDNAANRLQLESKADIKERLGVSPDMADALALTFAFPVQRADAMEVQRSRKIQSDWDPFEERE